MIQEIFSVEEKKSIARSILRELPEWFWDDELVEETVDEILDFKFYTIHEDEELAGFVALRLISRRSAELYVMGIKQEYQRKGIGKKLLEEAELKLKEIGIKLLHLKTLGSSNDNKNYKATRKFYRSMGYIAMDEFPEIWSEEEPCMIMVKAI